MAAWIQPMKHPGDLNMYLHTWPPRTQQPKGLVARDSASEWVLQQQIPRRLKKLSRPFMINTISRPTSRKILTTIRWQLRRNLKKMASKPQQRNVAQTARELSIKTGCRSMPKHARAIDCSRKSWIAKWATLKRKRQSPRPRRRRQDHQAQEIDYHRGRVWNRRWIMWELVLQLATRQGRMKGFRSRLGILICSKT